MSASYDDRTLIYTRGEGDAILVYSRREGGEKECECLLFNQERKTFIYECYQPLSEDVIEVEAYGAAQKYIINLFTCGSQITIPVPKHPADNITRTIHWFDSTAKSIVSALTFEGTGRARS